MVKTRHSQDVVGDEEAVNESFLSLDARSTKRTRLLNIKVSLILTHKLTDFFVCGGWGIRGKYLGKL